MTIEYYNTQVIYITGDNGKTYVVRDTSNGGIQCVLEEREPQVEK